MVSRSVREAIASLSSRALVKEHEILRVSGTLVGTDSHNSAVIARRQILQWTQTHCGGALPSEAWEFRDFEHFSGGRDTLAVSIQNDKVDIWALRSNDPDKTVARRIWTTEVVVAVLGGQLAKFGARLLVGTPESDLNIEPHTPGFVRQVAENCGLVRAGYSIDAEPWIVREEDFDLLLQRIVDPKRPMPLFLVSLPESASQHPFVDARKLAQAVIGLAQVAILPDHLTWRLTEALSKRHSVFGGAIRVYLTGFTPASNPYDHRLILAAQVSSARRAAQAVRWLRSLAARESVRGSALGRDTLAFSAVRSSALQLRQQQLVREGASESELLKAANAQLEALKKQLGEETSAQDYYVSEHDKAVERANAAEEQLRAAGYRIQALTGRLQQAGEVIDDSAGIPETWEEFAEWADSALSGRVSLSPLARRQVRNPLFGDVKLAARCLLWLATECRDRRVNGGEGSLGEESVEPGVRNSHCGNDEFDFSWQGQQHTADWHIKSGGNTRDPTRCLRIYYGWDDATSQIIVAEMPAHRRTGAT